MSRRNVPRALLLFSCVLLAGAAVRSDTDCPKCDCSHFPISDPDCVKCCFSEKITVTSSTDTSVTGKPLLGEGNQHEQTFKIEKTTRLRGKLQSGATATVYYHFMQGQRIATRVDELAALHGALVPADFPSPPDTCEKLRLQAQARGIPVPPIPPDAIKIFFGDSEGYSLEQRFIVWKIGDEEVLVLQRTESGMFVSAKVWGPDGKLLADIVDNEFFVNLRGEYRMETPQPSSLVVYDSHRQEVLYIQLLSPRVIKILGKFFGPNAESIAISQEEQAFTSKTGLKLISSGNCLGGGGAGMIELTATGQILVR